MPIRRIRPWVLIVAGATLAVVVWLARPASKAVQDDSTPAVDIASSVELDADKQKRIWDAEHITFKIESYVAPELVAGLLARDAAALQRFFHTDFEGLIPQPGGWSTRRAGIVAERARSLPDFERQTADAAGIVRHLLETSRGFTETRHARLRVLKIDRDEQKPDCWAVRLLLNVIGEGPAGAPRELSAKYDGEIRFADKSEFDEGRVISKLAVTSESVRTSERPLMVEVTEQAGLTALGLPDNWELPAERARNHRFQIAVDDYDRDGYLDIAIGLIGGRRMLLRSIGGKRFEDATESVGLAPLATRRQRMANALATWIDYDDDGYPDLLLGTHVYHNEKGKRFVDVTGASGLKFNRVPMGAVVADFNSDGPVDLYMVYQKTFKAPPPLGRRPWVGDSESGGENELWLNDGAGRFRNVTAASGAGGGNRQTFAAAALFYDADHHPDLYLANDLGINVLLRNRGDGTFEDVTSASEAGDFATSMGVAAGDMDNDGHAEIYVANMFSKMGRRIIANVKEDDYPAGVYEQILGSCAGNRLYGRSDAGSRFDEHGEELGINGVGWAYAPATVDLDGDGWLDLYSTTGFMSFKRGEPDG